MKCSSALAVSITLRSRSTELARLAETIGGVWFNRILPRYDLTELHLLEALRQRWLMLKAKEEIGREVIRFTVTL
jgi:hypothetical protein